MYFHGWKRHPFKLFHNLKSELGDSYEDVIHNNWDNAKVNRIIEFSNELQDVFALSNFNSWFNRVWTYQECCLPTRLIFCSSIDGTSCTAQDLCFVSEALYLCAVDGRNQLSGKLARSGIHGTFFWGNRPLHQHLSRRDGNTIPLSDALWVTRMRKCSRSEDKIYGILGVVKLKSFPPIIPNRDVQEALFDTVKCIDGISKAQLLRSLWNLDSSTTRRLKWLPPVRSEDGVIFPPDGWKFSRASLTSEGYLRVSGLSCSPVNEIGLFENYSGNSSFKDDLTTRIRVEQQYAKIGIPIYGTTTLLGEQCPWVIWQALPPEFSINSNCQIHIIATTGPYPRGGMVLLGILIERRKSGRFNLMGQCCVFTTRTVLNFENFSGQYEIVILK